MVVVCGESVDAEEAAPAAPAPRGPPRHRGDPRRAAGALPVPGKYNHNQAIQHSR